MKTITLIILLFSFNSFANYLDLATGDINSILKNRPHHPWPLKSFSIGHSISSYQVYDGEPYFHHGMDLVTKAYSNVYSSTSGKVVNVQNYGPGPLYWEVAILDEQGFLWLYHHIEEDTIPYSVMDAYWRGGKIKAGVKIGENVRWPYRFIEKRFDHLHFDILDKDRNYVNPMLLLKSINDFTPPEIIKIGLMQNRLPVETNTISGEYSVYVTSKDLSLSDSFYIPPYKIEYSLNGGEYILVWKFDKLPGGKDKRKYLHDLFVKELTCGDYQCRNFTIDLGFKKVSRRVFPKTHGIHAINVKVSDFSGNSSNKNFNWIVK